MRQRIKYKNALKEESVEKLSFYDCVFLKQKTTILHLLLIDGHKSESWSFVFGGLVFIISASVFALIGLKSHMLFLSSLLGVIGCIWAIWRVNKYDKAAALQAFRSAKPRLTQEEAKVVYRLVKEAYHEPQIIASHDILEGLIQKDIAYRKKQSVGKKEKVKFQYWSWKFFNQNIKILETLLGK